MRNELRITYQYQYVPVPVPVRAIREGDPMSHGGGDGEGGASDKSLPSTPAAPAVTTAVDSGGDDDSGPKTSNTTGQSTVTIPKAQQAEMTESSRVPRVPGAEMT